MGGRGGFLKYVGSLLPWVAYTPKEAGKQEEMRCRFLSGAVHQSARTAKSIIDQAGGVPVLLLLLPVVLLETVAHATATLPGLPFAKEFCG